MSEALRATHVHAEKYKNVHSIEYLFSRTIMPGLSARSRVGVRGV